MATEVVMPQMGESIAEGTITRWLKKVGEHVDRDEPLFEISTDKVDAEIPSPAAGTLTEVRYKEGDTVEVNTVVAVLDGAAAGGNGAAAPATVAAPVSEPATKPAPPAAEPKSEEQPKPEVTEVPATPQATPVSKAAVNEAAAATSAETDRKSVV